MKVRYRILLAIAFSVLFSGLIVYFVSSGPLIGSFTQLEDKRAREDILRVREALNRIIGELHGSSIDWAKWDDTYNFMTTQNPEYIQSNLSNTTLRDMKLESMIFLENDLGIHYSKSAGHEEIKELPHEIRHLFSNHRKLASSPTKLSELSGFIVIKDQPYAISIRGIYTSDGTGPRKGWLLFMRKIDANVLSELREITRQNVTFANIRSSDAKSVEFASIVSSKEIIRLEPLNDMTLVGYTALRDLSGKVGVTLKVYLPRAVTQQGTAVVWAIVYQLLAIGLAFGVVVVFVIERFALARLSQLRVQVEGISDFSGGSRVSLPGGDELTFLADRINSMLVNLERGAESLRASEERLKAHNENLEQAVLERTLEIEYQAFHDRLTGLPNRSLFLDRAESFLSKSRINERGVAVIFIDLDNFKLVNDSLGHDAGDLLLVAVAELLTKSVRPGDTVARLGGDEFTVLLDDLDCVEEATEIASRILQSLRKPIQIGSRETFAGASLGVAYCGDGSLDSNSLLKNADTAMYRAKTNGKSSFVVFDESMNESALDRLEIETELRKAIASEEITLAYQPLIDLQTKQIIGAEALARWNHSTRGPVPPGIFINIAEEMGLIVPIGYFILERACAQAVEWIANCGHPDFVMSVNLSGKQLQREDVVDKVGEILRRTGLKARNLKLEITESILLEDRDQIIQKMDALKQLGVPLALDDFGTGYSSLSTLNSFPIDTLKIDRSFISRLGEEESALAIVEAILALATTMRMSVIAEGVETSFQETIIRKLGCEIGQGYLYNKPLAAQAFEQLLRESLKGNHEQAA